MGKALWCDLGTGLAPLELDSGWSLQQVAGAQLLQQVASVRPDALILRCRRENAEALALLRQLRQQQPDVVRILLCHENTARFLAQASEVADFALSSTTSPDRVSYAIARAQQVYQRLHARPVLALLEGFEALSTLRSPLPELNGLIERQVQESTTSVAPLYRSHPELLKAVLAQLNTPVFGADRHLFNIDEAARLVGLRKLRDVTLLVELEQRLRQPAQWHGFAFEHLSQRALCCAYLAERISHSALADRVTQSAAYQAGLMHDLGMLLLAMRDPEGYAGVLQRAAQLKQPVYGLEKLTYGTTHAELSAAVLDRLGGSPRAVRATLFHHVPKASRDGAFSPLTAVHVADALLPQVPTTLECVLGGRLSLDYLNNIGMADKCTGWEKMARDQGVQLDSYW